MYPTTFYSVYGANGLGVFIDYRKVIAARPYLTSFGCKKFKTYLDAKNYAIESYNDLQCSFDYLILDDSALKMPYNKVLYRNQIFKL